MHLHTTGMGVVGLLAHAPTHYWRGGGWGSSHMHLHTTGVGVGGAPRTCTYTLLAWGWVGLLAISIVVSYKYVAN